MIAANTNIAATSEHFSFNDVRSTDIRNLLISFYCILPLQEGDPSIKMKKKATKSKPAWKLRPSTIVAPHQSPLPLINTTMTEEHSSSGACMEPIGRKRPVLDHCNTSPHIKRAHLQSQAAEIKQEWDTFNFLPLLKAYRIETWSEDIVARIHEAFLAAENALSAFNPSRLDKESRRLFFMKVFRILFAPSEANEHPIDNLSKRAYKPLSPLESFFRGIHGFLNETNLSTYERPFDAGPLPDPTLSFKSMRILCIAYAERINLSAKNVQECDGSNVANTFQADMLADEASEVADVAQPPAQGVGDIQQPSEPDDDVHPPAKGASATQLPPETSTSSSTGYSSCTVEVQTDLYAHVKTDDITLENYQKLLSAWHSSCHRVKELEQQVVDLAIEKAAWETKFNVLNRQFIALKESWQEKDDAAFRTIDNALTDVSVLCQRYVSRTVSEAATNSTNLAPTRIPRKQRNRYEEIIFWLKKENIKLSRDMYHAQQFAMSASNYIWELPQPYCSTDFADWSPLPHDDADSEEDSNEAGDYVHALSSNGRRFTVEEHSTMMDSLEEDKHCPDRSSASSNSAGVDNQSSRKGKQLYW